MVFVDINPVIVNKIYFQIIIVLQVQRNKIPLCQTNHLPLHKINEVRHFNIPFFISELGCPHRCVFCNQHAISGVKKVPLPNKIDDQVKAYLASFQDVEPYTEIAFFGGNFTGLPINDQMAYLNAAQKWVSSGHVNAIRLSTRPDYITGEVLKMLRGYSISSIELGAQSLDEEVLSLSGRGHCAKQVEEASALILEAGFGLCLQMMTGLPGDTPEKTMFTAKRIAELGATETRVYPALVIRGTQLEKLFRNGSYHPLTLNETTDRCKQLLLFFEANNVKVLRLGLHPSEGLRQSNELVAGPFHPALRELANTAIWGEIFSETLKNRKGKNLKVTVSPKELNAAIGHKGANKKLLLEHFLRVAFATDLHLSGRSFHVDIS